MGQQMHLQNVLRRAERPSHGTKLLSSNQQASGLAKTLRPADVVCSQTELLQEISSCRLVSIEDVKPKEALGFYQFSQLSRSRLPNTSSIDHYTGVGGHQLGRYLHFVYARIRTCIN